MKNKFIKHKSKIKGVSTIIEFSPNTIKLVQTAFKNKGVITNLAYQDRIGDSEYEITEALTKIIKARNIAIENLIISLDRSLVSLRLIKLPSVLEEEIGEMAKWQSAKLLPYKIDEIVVSHQTIKSTEDSFSYVILIIVPKNIVKKFIDICDGLKLQPKTITISSEGLLSWYTERQSHQPVNETLALVDVDRNRFELVVLYQNKFIFSRSLILSPQENDVELEKKIIEEIKLSVESYRKQELCQPINKVILTGDKSKISEFSSLFANEFNLTPAIINHFENIELERDISEFNVGKDVSFASVCGIALSQKPSRINLLPPEEKDRALYLNKKNQLLKTLYLAMFAVLVFLVFLGLNFYTKKKIIDNLNRELAKINPAAKQIQEIKNKMDIVNTQLDNENSCIEILREIHKVTPQNIFLATFIFEEGKEVTLKGMSPSMSLVFNFVPLLNKSAFFENVQVRYVTQRKTQTAELTDFEIICPLKNRTK